MKWLIVKNTSAVRYKETYAILNNLALFIYVSPPPKKKKYDGFDLWKRTLTHDTDIAVINIKQYIVSYPVTDL
jgi:hypothetical protein